MNPGNGRATASLVLGIISIFGICIPILGIVCGIIAIVMSRSSRKISQQAGFPVDGKVQAGFVLGIIGIIIGVVMWIINVALIGSYIYIPDIVDTAILL